MTPRQAPRARRSAPASRPAGPGPDTGASSRGWAVELSLAVAVVALVSAFANVVSVAVVSGTMATATPPEGAVTYLPVVAGAVLGLVGDCLLLSGAVGVLRPGARFTSGRGSVLAGLAAQLVAAAAVGTLEASILLTLVYLALLVALAVLWVRLTPAAPRPVAQHPRILPDRRPDPVPAPARWTLQQPPPPMTWSRGVPLPPSAPADQEDQTTVAAAPAAPAIWKRPER